MGTKLGNRPVSLVSGHASVAFIALMANALCAGAALAEEDEAGRAGSEIVVTGALPDDYSVAAQETSTRLDLSLRETPQAVSVINRAQIEDFNLDTVDNLLARATGVNVDRPETDRTYYNARGFDIVNFQFDGIGQPLSYGLQTGQLDTALFDRVEIVRGATGLLSQTGNPSAAINFVRKRPKRELGGYASLGYGSFNTVRGDVDVNTPLTTDGSIRTRFVGAYEGGDSYLDFYHASRLTLYGVAAVDLGPDTVLTAGYSWQNSDPRGVNWGALPLAYADGSPVSYARSATTAQPWTRWETTDRNLFADITHDFGGGWTATVSVLRRARDQNSKLFYVYGSQDSETGEGLYSSPGAYLDKLRETTIDAHINGRIDLAGRQHEVVLGVNYGRSLTREWQATAPDQAGVGLPGNSAFDGSFAYPDFGDYELASDFDTRISSVYGLARLSLADPLKLMVGGNVTKAERTGVNYGASYAFSRTRFLPFAGLTLDLNDHLTAYASYATIFNPQVEMAADKSILPPIEGSTYEAGLKGEWNNGRLTAAIAVFKTREDNVAANGVFDPSIGQTVYTATNARSQGVEVDVEGEVLPGLRVAGGYAYVDVEDEDGHPARTFIPRHTLRTSVIYSPKSLQALRLGASARFQSRIYNSYNEQKGYAIVDLMARYQLTRNISVAVNVDNLTNVKYWTSLQWDQAYYGAPRTVRGTIGVNF